MDNLSYIKIKGFKSIKELDLEMKPINVLIGTNGSGKSNFISVFRLLENVYNQRLQSYIKQSDGSERFFHFGSKITKEIIIDTVLADDGENSNGYFSRLKKNTETDTLFVNYDQTSFHNKNKYFNPCTQITTDSKDESSIKHTVESTAKYSKFFLQQYKLYHFHDTSTTSEFKSYQNIDANKYLSSFAANLALFLYKLKKDFNSDYKNIFSAVQTVASYFQDFNFNIKGENIILRWQHLNDLSNLGFSAQTLSDGTARFICMSTLFLQPKELHPQTIVLYEPEIEALLFGDAEIMVNNLNVLQSWIDNILNEFNDLEEINNSKETVPSKLIEKNVKYIKTQRAPKILQEIGLPKIREKCQGFDAWITQLEKLGE